MVNHQVHVSQSFTNSIQGEAADKTQQPISQFDKPSAWLDALGNSEPQLQLPDSSERS